MPELIDNCKNNDISDKLKSLYDELIKASETPETSNGAWENIRYQASLINGVLNSKIQSVESALPDLMKDIIFAGLWAKYFDLFK
jgi:hypothetical protein